MKQANRTLINIDCLRILRSTRPAAACVGFGAVYPGRSIHTAGCSQTMQRDEVRKTGMCREIDRIVVFTKQKTRVERPEQQSNKTSISYAPFAEQVGLYTPRTR